MKTAKQLLLFSLLIALLSSCVLLDSKYSLENFKITRLAEIASVLKAGELPAPINAVQTNFIGPSLGEESIKSGSNAMLLGLLLVFIFMLIYYKGSGLIANIALLINLLF